MQSPSQPDGYCSRLTKMISWIFFWIGGSSRTISLLQIRGERIIQNLIRSHFISDSAISWDLSWSGTASIMSILDVEFEKNTFLVEMIRGEFKTTNYIVQVIECDFAITDFIMETIECWHETMNFPVEVIDDELRMFIHLNTFWHCDRTIKFVASNKCVNLSGVRKVSILTTIHCRKKIWSHIISLSIRRPLHWSRLLSAAVPSRLAWSSLIHWVRQTAESRARSLGTLRTSGPDKFIVVFS
jgi:hypothetical protein